MDVIESSNSSCKHIWDGEESNLIVKGPIFMLLLHKIDYGNIEGSQDTETKTLGLLSDLNILLQEH